MGDVYERVEGVLVIEYVGWFSDEVFVYTPAFRA